MLNRSRLKDYGVEDAEEFIKWVRGKNCLSDITVDRCLVVSSSDKSVAEISQETGLATACYYLALRDSSSIFNMRQEYIKSGKPVDEFNELGMEMNKSLYKSGWTKQGILDYYDKYGCSPRIGRCIFGYNELYRCLGLPLEYEPQFLTTQEGKYLDAYGGVCNYPSELKLLRDLIYATDYALKYGIEPVRYNYFVSGLNKTIQRKIKYSFYSLEQIGEIAREYGFVPKISGLGDDRLKELMAYFGLELPKIPCILKLGSDYLDAHLSRTETPYKYVSYSALAGAISRLERMHVKVVFEDV